MVGVMAGPGWCHGRPWLESWPSLVGVMVGPGWCYGRPWLVSWPSLVGVMADPGWCHGRPCHRASEKSQVGIQCICNINYFTLNENKQKLWTLNFILKNSPDTLLLSQILLQNVHK
ncbi:hypothetical protein Btru_070970 [Bulinus truncatus]|nr:hypothetical protein Btru_070970 [Bulinus truncatus]